MPPPWLEPRTSLTSSTLTTPLSLRALLLGSSALAVSSSFSALPPCSLVCSALSIPSCARPGSVGGLAPNFPIRSWLSLVYWYCSPLALCCGEPALFLMRTSSLRIHPTLGWLSSNKELQHTSCTTAPTPQQQEAADKLVADTKAGVAKYTDLSAATTTGYQPMSPTWQPVTHYLNPAYQQDGKVLDPSRPEALVYANTSKGPILVAAMYLMPDPGDPGPQIGGCLTQWHAHSLLGWQTPEMMHMWIIDVPGGSFSEEVKPRELFGR